VWRPVIHLQQQAQELLQLWQSYWSKKEEAAVLFPFVLLVAKA
jgi:hypothetical protein